MAEISQITQANINAVKALRRRCIEKFRVKCGQIKSWAPWTLMFLLLLIALLKVLLLANMFFELLLIELFRGLRWSNHYRFLGSRWRCWWFRGGVCCTAAAIYSICCSWFLWATAWASSGLGDLCGSHWICLVKWLRSILGWGCTYLLGSGQWDLWSDHVNES